MLRYFRVTDHISPSPSHNQKPHYVHRTVSLHTSEVQHMNYRLYFWKNGTFEKSSSQEQSMCIVLAERNNPWTNGSPHVLQGNYLAGDTHVILQVCIYLLVFSAYTLLLLVLFFFSFKHVDAPKEANSAKRLGYGSGSFLIERKRLCATEADEQSESCPSLLF